MMNALNPELKAMGTELAVALSTGKDSEIDWLTSQLEDQLITDRYNKIWQHAKKAFEGHVIFNPSEEERESGIFFHTPYFTGPSSLQVLCLTDRLLRPEHGRTTDYNTAKKIATNSLNKWFCLSYEEASRKMYGSGMPFILTPEVARIPKTPCLCIAIMGEENHDTNS